MDIFPNQNKVNKLSKLLKDSEQVAKIFSSVGNGSCVCRPHLLGDWIFSRYMEHL